MDGQPVERYQLSYPQLPPAIGGSLTTTAATRAEIRQYHPVFRLPTRVTEVQSPLAPGSAFSEALIGGFRVPRVTDLRYDDTTGNLLSRTVSDPATGASRTWTYSDYPNGLLQTEDGPRTEVADTTTYTWYAGDDPDPGKRNNLATVTDPVGRITRYTAYDAAGRRLRSEAPNGVATTWSYDARGRVIGIETGGEATRYERDGTGEVIRLTQPDGAVFHFRYDSAHRLIEVADGDGHRIHYVLDAMGNRVDEQTYSAAGEMTERLSRAVDALNRVKQIQGNYRGYGADMAWITSPKSPTPAASSPATATTPWTGCWQSRAPIPASPSSATMPPATSSPAPMPAVSPPPSITTPPTV